jgi:hypothetical protein
VLGDAGIVVVGRVGCVAASGRYDTAPAGHAVLLAEALGPAGGALRWSP